MTVVLTSPNGFVKRKDSIGQEKHVKCPIFCLLSYIDIFTDLAPLTTVGNLVRDDRNMYVVRFAESMMSSRSAAFVYPSEPILPVARVSAVTGLTNL